MKSIDLLIKVNTAIIGIAALIGIFTSPLFFHDTTLQIERAEAKEDEAAVVAGAFTNDAAYTQPTNTPTPTATPTPLPVEDPVRIQIPSLSVDTTVTNVGVTPDNVMEIPEDFSQVGWFDQSLKPGEHGNKAAIMSGHFDTTTGAPAVFHLLETLESGDEVIVTAANDIKYIFAVTDVFSHPLDGFPTDIVYGETEGTSLKLITCDGVWHAGNSSYSDRLVVTTRLTRIEPPFNSEAP